jgi:hypothetical protein
MLCCTAYNASSAASQRVGTPFWRNHPLLSLPNLSKAGDRNEEIVEITISRLAATVVA